MRVYIGSFWNKPYMHTECSKLFEAEQQDLIRDLRQLPRNSAVRKVNELVKRARLVKVHAHIIAHLKGNIYFLLPNQTNIKLINIIQNKCHFYLAKILRKRS